jgi:hypothetical protein
MALSTSGTVSQRHEAARQDESKITAGQLAAAMRRRGYQVKAAELAEHAPEWHHAGWNPRGGMGKCYFFPASAATDEAEQARLMAEVEVRRAERARPRFGFKAGFVKSGRRWQPIIDVREFAAGKKMGKYEEITEDLYRRLLPHDGADLTPYESAQHAAERLGA